MVQELINKPFRELVSWWNNDKEIKRAAVIEYNKGYRLGCSKGYEEANTRTLDILGGIVGTEHPLFLLFLEKTLIEEGSDIKFECEVKDRPLIVETIGYVPTKKDQT